MSCFKFDTLFYVFCWLFIFMTMKLSVLVYYSSVLTVLWTWHWLTEAMKLKWVILETSLLNVRAEIPLTSGFEISVWKKQKDRSSAGLTRGYKVWVLSCWPGSSLSPLLPFCFVHCLLCIFFCLVFAQCLAQTSPVCYCRRIHCLQSLNPGKIWDLKRMHTHTHITYLPGCFNIFYRYIYLEEFRKMYLHCLHTRAFPITSTCTHPSPAPSQVLTFISSCFLENIWKLVSD